MDEKSCDSWHEAISFQQLSLYRQFHSHQEFSLHSQRTSKKMSDLFLTNNLLLAEERCQAVNSRPVKRTSHGSQCQLTDIKGIFESCLEVNAGSSASDYSQSASGELYDGLLVMAVCDIQRESWENSTMCYSCSFILERGKFCSQNESRAPLRYASAINTRAALFFWETLQCLLETHIFMHN